jgi:spore germination cell wall hydrolase CwlJ-like protein
MVGEDIRSVCTARWQFSCWFDGQAERVRFVDERNEKFAACLDVAKRVMAGEIADPTSGADYYYA